MSIPSNNGDGYGQQNEYSGGFNSVDNTPQIFHGNMVQHLPEDNYLQPIGNVNVLNVSEQNAIIDYQGQEYQSAYGYGPRNNVPQYIDPIRHHYAFQQQQLSQNATPLNPTFQPDVYSTLSNNGIQQNQKLQESPLNFKVPSNATQTSDENFTIGDLHQMDINDDEEYLYLTEEEFKKLLDDKTSDDLNSTVEVPIYHAPSFPSNQPIMNFNNVEVPLQSPTQSPSSSPTENPVGRPPKYETEEERDAAHKVASKKSYHKRKEEKEKERRDLEEATYKTEAENQKLRKIVAALKIRASNIFANNCQSFSDEQRNIFYQNKSKW